MGQPPTRIQDLELSLSFQRSGRLLPTAVYTSGRLLVFPLGLPREGL